ncbi:hypothetical protein Asi02nite_34840 [Asanoa siamensis]|uniref:Uncharacterized protein n=1 Tax=Asanoa siamensis TaxID=926357 RepID=A0ABQ4CRP1_9ACTN|nr:hypothetical protein Asi02nite_34840 [Asanoa siamensis]
MAVGLVVHEEHPDRTDWHTVSLTEQPSEEPGNSLGGACDELLTIDEAPR